MRIACISLFGNFCPIMERIQSEIGTENCLTILLYRDYQRWWDGLLTKPDPKGLVYKNRQVVNHGELIKKFKPDLIIFDMSGEGELADAYAAANWPVIGACEICDFLEMNRWYGMSVMSALGLSMPGVVEVKDYKQARDFLIKRDKSERWVIKFNDNQGNWSSYCSEDVNDMLEEIEHFNDSNRVNFKSGAVLQEFVEGIELSCEGWFNGIEFLPESFNYTMEEKKFLTGNLGPSTGCEGNLVWKARATDPVPLQMIKLSPLLRKYGYVGPFDLNNIFATEEHHYPGFSTILKRQNYVLEPTPRFGYDAIYTLLEGYQGRISDLFEGLVNRSTAFSLIDQPLMGVRVSIPPYPYNDISQTEDKRVEGLAKATMKFMEYSVQGTITRLKDPTLLRKVWFQDIRWDEKYRRLVVNGTDSVIAVCTATGQDLKGAITEAYRIVKTVDVPNAQYRLDIGRRAFKEIPKLVEFGVIRRPHWLEDREFFAGERLILSESVPLEPVVSNGHDENSDAGKTESEEDLEPAESSSSP